MQKQHRVLAFVGVRSHSIAIDVAQVGGDEVTMSSSGQTKFFNASTAVSGAKDLERAGQDVHVGQSLELAVVGFLHRLGIHFPHVLGGQVVGDSGSDLGEELQALGHMIYDLGLGLTVGA